MTATNDMHSLRWECATGLPPLHDRGERCPQGMLVTDSRTEADRVAVVYEKGDPPPEITIEEVSGSVHTVFANGVAVAIVACTGRTVQAADVILVEQEL